MSLRSSTVQRGWALQSQSDLCERASAVSGRMGASIFIQSSQRVGGNGASGDASFALFTLQLYRLLPVQRSIVML